MFKAAGAVAALVVVSGGLVAACGSAGAPSPSGGSLAPPGTAGSPPGTDPGSSPILPPPQSGEVTMYGTFFVGDSLDVLHEYDIALESSSYVIAAIRSGTGAIGLLDRYTDPSYSDIWYGTYTTAGRLFSTTFGGDTLDELRAISERDPITYGPMGLTVGSTGFASETFAIVGDTIYGVELVDGEPTILRESAGDLVPVARLDDRPIRLVASGGLLYAVSSRSDDAGQYVWFAEIHPESGTVEYLGGEFEVTDNGTYRSWRVTIDDRDRVAYLVRGSASEGLVELYSWAFEGDMELVAEETVPDLELITGFDADRGQVLIQWRANDESSTYLLVDADSGTTTELDVPIRHGATGTQLISH